MWITKWIIGEFLGFATISEAVNRLIQRTGINLEVEFMITKTIIKNILVIMIPLIIWINALIIFILCCIYKGKSFSKEIINYVIIAVLPIVWYVFTKQHSYIHAKFTYRIIGISTLALSLGIIQVFKLDKKCEINRAKNN